MVNVELDPCGFSLEGGDHEVLGDQHRTKWVARREKQVAVLEDSWRLAAEAEARVQALMKPVAETNDRQRLLGHLLSNTNYFFLASLVYLVISDSFIHQEDAPKADKRASAATTRTEKGKNRQKERQQLFSRASAVTFRRKGISDAISEEEFELLRPHFVGAVRQWIR
jgi:hypothetical protein